MRLSDLLQAAGVTGAASHPGLPAPPAGGTAFSGAPSSPGDPRDPRDPDVTGVGHDSHRIAPGDLFVALPGRRFDGRDFVAAAVGRGAVAVLGQPPRSGNAAQDPAVAVPPVPWIEVDNPRAWLGPLAAAVYGHPDRELVLCGVTGTNGKTTVTLLVAAACAAAGLPCGTIGTLGYQFAGRSFPGAHTTPEASDLFRTLRGMRQAGARAVAMEVSSHALTLGRVDGAVFDAGVFTNLTRDHLDHHPDMESYFAAKRGLFARLKPGGRAALNLDDPYGRRLARELADSRPLTFGFAEGEVHVRASELAATGIRAVLATPRGELAIATPLVGRFNLANLLAAVAAAEALALPHTAIAGALAAQRPVPGRMEPVERGQPFPVYIDYAHTDAALAAALRSLREVTGGGKLAVVFGCGGERDRGKRALMGRVAGELAELPIATSDNPRSEDPDAILSEVEEGLRASGNRAYRLVPDRREAIRQALAAAGPGWAVLVAGKGHEREQIVGDRRIPFSDLDEVGRALEERFG